MSDSVNPRDHREQLKNICLTDIVSARRVADTLREGLVSSLLSRVDKMEIDQIMTCMAEINKMPIDSYRDVLGLIETA
jgi:hypothetical protein